MEEHLDNMIDLYQSFWSSAKKDEQEAMQNQGSKFNRQKLLRARTQKECYADFVNHLVGLRSVMARAEKF